MYCARSHRGEDRRVRTLCRASRRSPSQDMIGGRYVDDEVLRVVAHDGAHRSGNKNCSRLGIKASCLTRQTCLLPVFSSVLQTLIQEASSPALSAGCCGVLGTSWACWGHRQRHAKSQHASRKQCRPGRATERTPSIDRLCSYRPFLVQRASPALGQYLKCGLDMIGGAKVNGLRVIAAAVEEGVEALAPLPVRVLPDSSARNGIPRFSRPPI